MVRSLIQWTKTLSFPSRLSPSQNSKDRNELNSLNQVLPAIPQRNNLIKCSTKASSTRLNTFSNLQNKPITELEEIIYPGADPKQTIMGSLVFCIHHKEGCKWSDEMRKLKPHLNVCKFDAIQCPNKCGAQIPRIMITDHLQYTCNLRRTMCNFCEKEFSGKSLDEHNGNCGQEPIYCEAKCGQKILRSRSTVHKTKDCSKRLLQCTYCTRKFSADTLILHTAQCSRVSVVCPQRSKIGSVTRADINNHLEGESNISALACTFKDAGCSFKGPLHLLESHLEANTASHLSLLVELSKRQNEQIHMLKSAVSKLSINYTGTLLWKINNWSIKMAEARSESGLELISPPFFTSQYGYKLQTSMFLNGNGPGENTHVSVYIKVLPGEYDALLKWPFSHSITFTLFEQGIQNGQCGVTESFVPDPTWENFQRPSNKPDQLGFGFPRFISHKLLHNRPFIKKDTVFLRIKVDPRKIVTV